MGSKNGDPKELFDVRSCSANLKHFETLHILDDMWLYNQRDQDVTTIWA